jgi:Flp pilus assembly protein TadG
MRAATRSARRRAASAAEFAVILPALMLIVLGCVDFGRFAYHYLAIQNAARAGAEYAIMTPYTPTAKDAWKGKVRTAAGAELEGQTGYDPAGLTVTVPDPVVEGNGLRRVRVEVAYTGFETVVSWPGIPDAPTLRAAVVMRAVR